MDPINRYQKPARLSLNRLEKQSPILIQAPSGFGKTALARQLFTQHSGDKYWCQASGVDNVAWLTFHLLTGLGISSRVLAQDSTQASVESSGVTITAQTALAAMAWVTDKLIQNDNPLLVIDGLNADFGEQANQLINLLNGLVPNCSIILTAQNQNKGTLIEWLTTSQGMLVNEGMLAFSDTQIQSLQEQVPNCYQQGLLAWPLAFALAHEFTGTEQQFMDLLFSAFSQRLFNSLTDTEKKVLHAASIAPAFNVEYLVATTQQVDAPQALKVLQEKGLIQRIEKGRFALGHVFKAFVLNEFQYLQWDVRKGLKDRAARFWAEHNEFEKALNFCQQYQLWQTAADLLVNGAETYINAGRFEEMHKWIEALPAQTIDHDPLLMVYRVWCFPEYQKINGADIYLQQVQQLLEDPKSIHPPVRLVKARVQLCALKGYIARIAGDYQQAVDHAQQAVAMASEAYPAILSRLYTTIGQDLYLKGDLVAAEASLSKAVALGKQYKKHHDVLIALGYAIASLVFMGRLSQAIANFKEAMIWFEESGFLATEASMVLNDLLIDAYRESFDLDRAGELSNEMVGFCEQTNPALPHLVTYIRRYRLAISREDSRLAYQALTQAESFREVLDVSWAFGWAPVPAIRAEYELRYGSLNKASDYFSGREAELMSNNEFGTECERFIFAQWLAAVERQEEAYPLLLTIRDQALKEQRLLQGVRASVQLSLLLWDQDPASAILHLRDAIRVVPEGEQIIAPFLWYGKKIQPLLDQVGSQLYQDLSGIQLLNQIKQKAGELWPIDYRVNLLDSISERQLTILKLLVEGDQDKVIAKKLAISPGTVKTHLRTIYRKLNCSNRAQAVSVAMEHGLLLFDNADING